MPFLSNNYVYEITNPEETSDIMIDTVNTNGAENTSTYTILTNQSKKFYNDFISLLNQTDIDFTYNEDDYSFTIFGLTFYLFVKMINSANFTMVPLMQRQLGYEYGDLRFIAKNSIENGNAVGFETTSSITNATENNILKYGLELCYNSNFIHATYISYTGVKYPLCTIIKGQVIDNTDVIYTSGCINTYDTFNTAHGNAHKVILQSSPKQTIPPQVNYNQNNEYNCIFPSDSYPTSTKNYIGVFDRTFNNSLNYLRLLKPDIKESIILKKATAFGRLVSFENVFDITINTIDNTIPHKFSLDHFYKINGETYYCPGNYISQNVNNYDSDTRTTVKVGRFLLKL